MIHDCKSCKWWYCEQVCACKKSVYYMNWRLEEDGCNLWNEGGSDEGCNSE